MFVSFFVYFSLLGDVKVFLGVDCLNKKAVSDAKKEKRDQKKAEFYAKRAEERQEKLSNLKLFVL